MHPFERRGLGQAPFRVVAAYRDVGPHRSTDPTTGVTVEVGAPGQPMGTCRFCMQGIANIYRVRSADGREFTVGPDCVQRTAPELGKTGPEAAILRAFRREQTARRLAERREAAHRWLAQHPLAFTGSPHPAPYRALQGQTMRDYLHWCLDSRTTSAITKAARIIEADARLTTPTETTA